MVVNTPRAYSLEQIVGLVGAMGFESWGYGVGD